MIHGAVVLTVFFFLSQLFGNCFGNVEQSSMISVAYYHASLFNGVCVAYRMAFALVGVVLTSCFLALVSRLPTMLQTALYLLAAAALFSVTEEGLVSFIGPLLITVLAVALLSLVILRVMYSREKSDLRIQQGGAPRSYQVADAVERLTLMGDACALLPLLVAVVEFAANQRGWW